MKFNNLKLLVIGLFVLLVSTAQAQTEKSLWRGLQSGDYIVLMRHALAPGIGDPPQMQLERCETQRNLNEVGRAQARRIGAVFKAQGLSQAEVYSSEWCRCLETAQLLGLGNVQRLSELNSFFTQPNRAQSQTMALKTGLVTARPKHPLVLVTHQVNITELTKVFPQSGELVFIKKPSHLNDEIIVQGRIQTLDEFTAREP